MMEELGSGFYLAMHDLEIRGAGEVLGESQSGEMQEVGFNLYARMLERAVRALKAGKAPELDDAVDVTTEINLHVPALLPASYCSDVHERLSLYKRLADSDDARGARRAARGADRPLRRAARAGARAARVPPVRIAARPLGVARIDATHEAVQLQFIKNPPLDGAKVIAFIAEAAQRRGSPARTSCASRRSCRPGRSAARRCRTSCSSSRPESTDPAGSRLNLVAPSPSLDAVAQVAGDPPRYQRRSSPTGLPPRGCDAHDGDAKLVRSAPHRLRLDGRRPALRRPQAASPWTWTRP